VVIGLDSMTGLQSARILARRGVPVIGLAKDAGHYACATNVCERIVIADWRTEDLVEALARVGRGTDRKAVLVPCTDMSVLLISRHRRTLRDCFEFVLADEEVIEALMDKARFARHAGSLGLPIPRTLLLANGDEAECAAAQLTYPVVMKPSVKDPRWERAGLPKAQFVSGPAELLEFYDRASRWADILTAQEWVVGPDRNLVSCNCYVDRDGVPQVTFVARKLRQWPPVAGVSSLGEECRDDVVLAETLRVFGVPGFRGLGYVEMKIDQRTGKHFIIEPNVGRPTGRSAIAEIAGVELLYTMYCDALGKPLPEGRRQQYGDAKWVYLRHDLQSALYHIRRGDLTFGDWARSWRGIRQDAVIDRRDLGPFWRDVRNAAAGLRRRRQKGT
jgi:predicted ATP-grasp superfamily ATP-dependent carboligase